MKATRSELASTRGSLIHRVLERFEVGPSIYVRGLLVEPERNALWVGTSSGVHEVDLETRDLRNTFTRDHGLANEYVFAIGLDHQGHKWFGTNAGGVSRYKDGDWKVYFPMHGLADYWVYSFASQHDGTLWIGTWAGANSVDPLSGEFTTYVSESTSGSTASRWTPRTASGSAPRAESAATIAANGVAGAMPTALVRPMPTACNPAPIPVWARGPGTIWGP